MKNLKNFESFCQKINESGDYFDSTNIYQFNSGMMIIKNADLMKFRDYSGDLVRGSTTFISPYDAGRFRRVDDLYFDTMDGKMKSVKNLHEEDDITKEDITKGVNQDIKNMFNKEENEES